MVNALSYMRQAREWAMPTRTTSAFLEKGVLTPEEYVIAGDELVFRCPTWSWEEGDPKKTKSYLPVDKQYLVTRNVPCQTRVASMENFVATEGSGGILDDDDEGDWLVSSIIKQEEDEEKRMKQQQDADDDFDILDEEGEVMKPAAKPAAVTASAASSAQAKNQDEEEYADMADYEDDNIMEDDAAAVPASTTNNAADDDETNDSIIKVRTYDLSITYDKYYQVPRVWIVGKSAQGQPLTGEEMMQDVISDYANRTVTIENHPHVSGPHASIHPCQHGKVMKAIVRNLIKSSNNSSKTTTGTAGAGDATNEEGGDEGHESEEKGPSVEVYIFIFLKFVSSIIPTINYDFTMDVTADTSK